MNNIRILIVEKDLTIPKEILGRLIEKGYEVIGRAFNVADALEIVKSRLPDILLIDINLIGDEDSFELVHLLNTKFQIPFIFLASIDEEKLLDKAKGLNPSAILIQPYNCEQVQISIEVSLKNFSNFSELKNNIDEFQITKSSMDLLNHCLFFKKNNHFERVDFDDVYWLKAESNYTVIHTLKGKYIYSTVLKNFEAKLPSDQFIRVHRSYIINLVKIEGFEGKMVIIDKKYIPITKSCRNKIFKMLHVV